MAQNRTVVQGRAGRFLLCQPAEPKALAMDKPTKTAEFIERLKADIAKRKPGDRLPTKPALAKKFGVSVSVVTNAQTLLQAEKLIQLRSGQRATVCEPPSSTRRRTVVLLITKPQTTELFDLVSGDIAGFAKRDGWEHQRLLASDLAEAMRHCDDIAARKVDGVLFVPFEQTNEMTAYNKEIVFHLRTNGIAVVLLDRDLAPFPERSDFDIVGIDNLVAGYLAANHLYGAAGKRKVLFLAKPNSAATVAARVAGARAAHARVAAKDVATKFAFEEGDPDDAELARRLVEQYDGVVCANDDTARRLLAAVQRMPLGPKDFDIVGFDATRDGPTRPPFSTIRQPVKEIAALAYRALLDRVADPDLPTRSILLPPKLEARGS